MSIVQRVFGQLLRQNLSRPFARLAVDFHYHRSVVPHSGVTALKSRFSSQHLFWKQLGDAQR